MYKNFKTIHKKMLQNHVNQGFKALNAEAPTRFELVIEVLQTFALPLGHGALL